MKKLITCIAAILFSAALAEAQIYVPPQVVTVPSTPSTCNTLPLQVVTNTNQLYGTNGSGGCSAIGGGGGTAPLYLDWTFNSGAAATDASPRFLASHTATIANCYVLTTASDGSTALTFNIFDNGTTIFTSGAQTVAAATSPGTLTTISGLSITSITNNDKMSINITSGTSSWVFTVTCK